MDNFMKNLTTSGKTTINIEISDGNQDSPKAVSSNDTPTETDSSTDDILSTPSITDKADHTINTNNGTNQTDSAMPGEPLITDGVLQNGEVSRLETPLQSNSSDEIAALRNEMNEIKESIARLNTQFESVNKNYMDDITSFTTILSNHDKNLSSIQKSISTYNESLSSFKKLITDEQSLQIDNYGDILSKIEQVKSIVSTIQKNVSSNSLENKLNAKIESISETVENINYNILSSPQTDANSEAIQTLNKKLAEYQDDLYMKLLRKYVIDSHISLYTQVNDLAHTLEDDKHLNIVLKNIISKLETIGIKTQISKSGDPFDPKRMTTGHYPNIETSNETLAGKVAESICPAFIWNLPTIRQQSNQMILKEEEVTLYIIN